SAAQPPSTSASASKPVTPERADTKKTDQSRNPTNTQATPQASKPETSKPAPTPATVALDSGPSRISTREAQQPSQTTPDVAPSLGVGNGSSSATLSSLAKASNTAAPTALKRSELLPLQV